MLLWGTDHTMFLGVCINKANHVLLMHRFGILNTLIPGHYIMRQLIHLSLLYNAGPETPILMKTLNHLLTVKQCLNKNAI